MQRKGVVKMKKTLPLKLLSLIVAVCMIISGFSVSVSATDNDENILFSGSATAKFTDWSSWQSAVSLGTSDFDVSQFHSPFTFMVSYESKDMPILIFQSWSGGTSWAHMTPSYVSNGVAYFRYDVISKHYGTDFSLLDSIKVMPNGSDLTVTKVSFKYQTEEISVSFNGLAGKVANDIRVGWNLGNTLESNASWITEMTNGTPTDYETAWCNPVTTKKMIEDVKSAGFNAIRVPVTWEPHMDSNGIISDEWMDRVQEVVDYVIDSDMYCILNVHHDTGENKWLLATSECVKQNGDKFKNLWSQIANRFKDYDSKLLFEGFNEILDSTGNWEYSGTDATTAVNDLNQIFVDAVRKTGGNNSSRCLVVNTYAANTNANNLDEFIIPADSAKNSIIVEIHYYHPYKYCTASYPDSRTWTDENGKCNMNGTLYNLYNHFTSKGIPVIIGEWGVSYKENESDRCDYAEYFITEAKGYGIKCFYWDPGGSLAPDESLGYFTGMTLYDRFSNQWAFPQLVESITKSAGSSPVYIIGDADLNNSIDIKDVTLIQKHLADIIKLDSTQSVIADVNSDDVISIKDATAIQSYIAGLSDNDSNCGEPMDSVTPTEPETTVPETTSPETTTPELKNYIYYQNTNGWSKVMTYFWSDSNTSMTVWPGIDMESIGNGVYRAEIPDNAQYIIFNNGSGTQTGDIKLEGMNKIYNNGVWSEYLG